MKRLYAVLFSLAIALSAFSAIAAETQAQLRKEAKISMKKARSIALKKSLQFFGLPSPDGRQLLYWGDDANYWSIDLATGQKRNVTKDVAASFANTEDDHNNIFPPSNARTSAGRASFRSCTRS